MRMNCIYRQIKLDTRAFKKELVNALETAIKEAARNWIKATAVAIIPVWSGASRATFLALANAASFDLDISGFSDNAPIRIPLGMQESEGSLTADKSKLRFTFIYKTTLDHLIFNEYNNANLTGHFRLRRPGPYGFQTAGAAAFAKFAPTVSLPNPFGSLKIKEVKK